MIGTVIQQAHPEWRVNSALKAHLLKPLTFIAIKH